MNNQSTPVHTCRFCGANFDPYLEKLQQQTRRMAAPGDMLLCDQCGYLNIIDTQMKFQLLTADLVRYMLPYDPALPMKLFMSTEMLRQMYMEQKEKFARLN